MGSSVGGLLGGIAGSFLPIPGVGTALGSAAGSLLGGALGGGSAQTANQNQAQALSGAGQRAYQSSMFRPVGVTTNFGGSTFQVDPTTGQLTSAGYSLSPQLQNIQQGLLGSAAAYDPSQYQNASQGLFKLGQSYLATSPAQAAQDWYQQQQNVLAPGREQQLAQTTNKMFQTGRSGLATGGTKAGGLLASSPEMAALYNAQANQDRQLAAQADQYGMDRTKYGLGLMTAAPSLFNAGYSPLTTQLGLANTIEGLGQNAFTLGTGLGTSGATAGANAGRLGLAGAEMASPYSLRAQSYNPLATTLQGQSTLGMTGTSTNSPLSDWFTGVLGNPGTAFKYGTNIGSDQTNMLAAQEQGFWK